MVIPIGVDKEMFEFQTKCNSEIIEPAMGHIIGVHYKRVKEILTASDEELFAPYDHEPYADYRKGLILKACSDWWWTMETMRKLSIQTPGAVHFSLAIGNEYILVAKYIKSLTGIDPMNTDDIMFNFKGRC